MHFFEDYCCSSVVLGVTIGDIVGVQLEMLLEMFSEIPLKEIFCLAFHRCHQIRDDLIYTKKKSIKKNIIIKKKKKHIMISKGY